VRFNLGVESFYKAGFPSKQDAAAVTVGCGQQQTPVIWTEVISVVRIRDSLPNHKSSFWLDGINNLDACRACPVTPWSGAR
jgi:hypothetical protein